MGIVASKDENSNLFHIIAGERRWRAAQKAGLKKVPVIVRDFDATNASIVALVENLHREDLNPIDKARGLSELIHTHKLRQRDLATEVGMSRASIANLLRLLKLSKKVQKSVISCEISEGHAKVLAGLPISE